jgi:hypothetical protein
MSGQPTLKNNLPLSAETHNMHHPQHHQQEAQHDDMSNEGHETDSDELHATRRNRWRGHPSTWKSWTEADRQTWTALENGRKEDLAVHLYNAFGLRRGFRVGPVPVSVEVRSSSIHIVIFILLFSGSFFLWVWLSVGGWSVGSFSGGM